MNALALTLKILATLVLLACYAATIEWHWDSDAPPPVPVVEPVNPAAVEDWSVVA